MAVAATDSRPWWRRCYRHALVVLVAAATGAGPVAAATLPEDRVEAFYHRYEGGGMVIDGPSVLVRKNAGNQASFSGQYYVDSVSAASVDVLATASKYSEERTEYTLGADYLQGDAILSLGFTNSSENDYEANTVHFSVSQEFFGGLSTLTLGYARGWDTIREVGNADFEEEAQRQNYQLGLSQVITRNSLVSLDLELVTDEGFLQNPYRQNRYLDPDNPGSFAYQPERYPETRTSFAVAPSAIYYLPWRASVSAGYRYFTDSWDIDAHTWELDYVHSLGAHWLLEGGLRFYSQEQADFYSDLFPFRNSQTHLGRDKELSSFSGTTVSGGVSYQWHKGAVPGMERVQLSLLLDYLDFRYDNFRDVTAPGDFQPGAEPLYQFDALVTRASLILEF